MVVGTNSDGFDENPNLGHQEKKRLNKSLLKQLNNGKKRTPHYGVGRDAAGSKKENGIEGLLSSRPERILSSQCIALHQNNKVENDL